MGRLLVWPNVRDDRPARAVADMRMVHEARPIAKGVKVAANIWVNLWPHQSALTSAQAWAEHKAAVADAEWQRGVE